MLPLEVITLAIFFIFKCLQCWQFDVWVCVCVFSMDYFLLYHFLDFFVCRYRMSYYEHSVFNMHSMCLLWVIALIYIVGEIVTATNTVVISAMVLALHPLCCMWMQFCYSVHIFYRVTTVGWVNGYCWAKIK